MATRLLTINIRNYLVNQPRRKRPMRISNWIRFRIAQSTNIRTDNIRISKELNTIIMKEHLKSMKKLKVNINIDKDIATITPFVAKPAAKPVDAKAPQPAAPVKAATAPAKAQTAATQTKQPAQPAASKKDAPKKTDAKNSSV